MHLQSLYFTNANHAQDYMNNGNPQIITKSDFKQWFPHMLCPENSKPCLFPPHTSILYPERTFVLIHCYILCFISAHLLVVGAEEQKEEEKQKGSTPPRDSMSWWESETLKPDSAQAQVKRALPAGWLVVVPAVSSPQWPGEPDKNSKSESRSLMQKLVLTSLGKTPKAVRLFPILKTATTTKKLH